MNNPSYNGIKPGDIVEDCLLSTWIVTFSFLNGMEAHQLGFNPCWDRCLPLDRLDNPLIVGNFKDNPEFLKAKYSKWEYLFYVADSFETYIAFKETYEEVEG